MFNNTDMLSTQESYEHNQHHFSLDFSSSYVIPANSPFSVGFP